MALIGLVSLCNSLKLIDIVNHLFGFAFMLADTVLSSIPVRLMHGIYTCLFGAVYVIFSSLYAMTESHGLSNTLKPKLSPPSIQTVAYPGHCFILGCCCSLSNQFFSSFSTASFVFVVMFGTSLLVEYNHFFYKNVLFLGCG